MVEGISMEHKQFENKIPYQIDGFQDKLFQHSECLFCSFVLKGDNCVYQDEFVYVFKDIKPDASFHYQMISKFHLQNLNSLDYTSELHYKLLTHMRDKSHQLIRELHPQEVERNQIKLGSYNQINYKFIRNVIFQFLFDFIKYYIFKGFHKPRFTSQNHLHMHCLIGERKIIAAFQFNCFTFTSIQSVCRQFEQLRLQQQKKNKANL